ncbi:MAG: hypothetical protein P4M09_30795 [Devosia sp.]|nr:hypothetical protein [Devosia sp.]
MRGLLTVLLGVSLAAVAMPCWAQCATDPAFSAEIDPSGLPPIPETVTSLGQLERFRSLLELFRLSAEDYNTHLQEYSAALTRLDSQARLAAAAGRCSNQDYAELRDKIQAEFVSVGTTYLDLYYAAIAKYRVEFLWYQRSVVQTASL